MLDEEIVGGCPSRAPLRPPLDGGVWQGALASDVSGRASGRLRCSNCDGEEEVQGAYIDVRLLLWIAETAMKELEKQSGLMATERLGQEKWPARVAGTRGEGHSLQGVVEGNVRVLTHLSYGLQPGY